MGNQPLVPLRLVRRPPRLLERLTDRYVAGEIELDEFERQADELFAAGTADRYLEPPKPLNPATPSFREY